MIKKKLILLGGQKRSGKNTTATLISLLLSNRNIPNTTLAFASKLKMEVCSAYGISIVELEANKEFWRPVLQFWGNEYRRGYCNKDTYWVDYVVKDIQLYHKHFPTAVILITDWRHKAESETLNIEYDVTKLWVSRNYINVDTHSSENELNSKMADYVVENNSSIDKLERELYTILRAVKIL